jgi:hypothetical protein
VAILDVLLGMLRFFSVSGFVSREKGEYFQIDNHYIAMPQRYFLLKLIII